MTRTSLSRRAVPLSVAAVIACVWLANAGDLNPPAGPIGPTMKTLDEVEPRVAINATNTPGDADSVFSITQSGSYYLTGNVTGQSGKHGIQLEADGVTLDLSGFTLLGVAGSFDGINMPAFRENVVIRNGHLRGWGQSGVESRIDLGRIEKVTAADNGAWGIDNAPSGTFTTRIASCEALNNGDQVAGSGGIRGGQASVITDCLSFNNAGDGITAANGCLVTGCTSRSNGVDGISVSAFGTVTGCTAIANTGDGIELAGDCRVAGNTCCSNGSGGADGAGIHATSVDNRIEGNTCTDSDRGIDVDGTGNIIVRNTCSGNATNWDVVAGNVILVVNATTAAAVLGNSGGVAPGSTDPSANFTY
jgi:parallel beta-helix repeat protein